MQVYKKMRYAGLLLWFTGCVRLYKDGDGFDAIFRVWHPVTWLVMLIMIIPCALMGEQIFYIVPISLSKFWKANYDQLQWVTPFTDLDTLKPFVIKLKKE